MLTSELITMVIGTILGAMLSYIGSYMVEKRLYERQLKDKLREKIFNPLIDELEENISILKRPTRIVTRAKMDGRPIVKYNQPSNERWEDIRRSGFLIELDRSIRANLREFYEGLKEIIQLTGRARRREHERRMVDKALLNEIDRKKEYLLKRAEELIDILDKEAERLGIRLKPKR